MDESSVLQNLSRLRKRCAVVVREMYLHLMWWPAHGNGNSFAAQLTHDAMMAMWLETEDAPLHYTNIQLRKYDRYVVNAIKVNYLGDNTVASGSRSVNRANFHTATGHKRESNNTINFVIDETFTLIIRLYKGPNMIFFLFFKAFVTEFLLHLNSTSSYWV